MNFEEEKKMAHATRRSHMLSRRLARLALAFTLTGLLSWAFLPAGTFRFVSPTAHAANFVVTNTDVSGPGSLRQAILSANGNGSAVVDNITFNIPGNGPKTIKPTAAAPLPPITTPVIIDGFTEPFTTPNSNATGAINALLRIEIDGTDSAGGADGLTFELGSDGSVVKGLVINRFTGNGIAIRAHVVSVKGCYIGTDYTGTSDLGNETFGVLITTSGVNIGGPNPADRNLISGNNSNGIRLEDNATNNMIRGNLVGTNKAGDAALGNGASGIAILTSNNLVGGKTPAERNVVSGNALHGVVLYQSAATFNAVFGNYIGTNATGTAALGNMKSGISVQETKNNFLGSSDAGAGNLISGNKEHGIHLSVQAHSNAVKGNYIGTDASGSIDLGNNLSGVRIDDSKENMIGGNSGSAPNLISGNNSSGIEIIHGDDTRVENNFIGTKADGVSPLGNSDAGISIGLSSGNKIGGTGANVSNIIAYNGKAGVLVTDGSEGNAILGNYIFSQGEVGIDLRAPTNIGSGASPNDPGDNDAGGNLLQNYPVITAASLSASGISLSGTLNSKPSSDYRIEYFGNMDCDPSGHGEGKSLLVTKNVTTDANGNADVSITVPIFTPWQFITATATDSNNNTSEFSKCRQVNESHGTLNFSHLSYSVNESAGSATITVTRTGGSGGTVSVRYDTSPGTTGATPDVDYTNTSGTITFGPGDSASKTFTVQIRPDTLHERNEMVNLRLSNPTGGATLGSYDKATLHIEDDDPAPSISINDVSVTEGNDPASLKSVTFNVSLSTVSGKDEEVLYQTSDGTAQGGNDYEPANDQVVFSPGQTSKTITVRLKPDTDQEPDETFFVNLSVIINDQLDTKPVGTGTGTILNDDVPQQQQSAFELTQSSYTVMEDEPFVTVTVNRTGDTSQAATVQYATTDTAGLSPCTISQGRASERCDYATSVGTLRWAVGEGGTKSFSVPVINDVHVEGAESFNVTLTKATGGTLGAQATAAVTITDNDHVPSSRNPIDGVEFFVTLQYIDFLNRLPDPTGLQNWVHTLAPCPQGGFGNDNPDCDRIHVSKGFYQSDEFRGRGYWAYRFYEAALGRRPSYAEFIPDMAKVGGPKSPQEEALSKEEFIAEFVHRAEFLQKYAGMKDDEFLNALEQTAGVQLQNRSQLMADLQSQAKTRAQVLRAVVESKEVEDAFYIEGFVSIQYFGYLRRDPDQNGFQNWVQTLSQTGDFRHMIFGFVYSAEYRERFGPQ
jgi:hypothetical protein